MDTRTIWRQVAIFLNYTITCAPSHLAGLLCPLSATETIEKSPGTTRLAKKNSAKLAEFPGLKYRPSGLRQRGFRLVDDCSVRFGLVHGQIGQNLAVHFDSGQRQAVDEARVGQRFVV